MHKGVFDLFFWGSFFVPKGGVLVEKWKKKIPSQFTVCVHMCAHMFLHNIFVSRFFWFFFFEIFFEFLKKTRGEPVHLRRRWKSGFDFLKKRKKHVFFVCIFCVFFWAFFRGEPVHLGGSGGVYPTPSVCHDLVYNKKHVENLYTHYKVLKNMVFNTFMRISDFVQFPTYFLSVRGQGGVYPHPSLFFDLVSSKKHVENLYT